MIAFPAGARVWIAGGVTDMRQGMNSLALAVQEGLGVIHVQARSSASGGEPSSRHRFESDGERGDLVKLLWHDGVGMSLYIKRLEVEKFISPAGSTGAAVAILVAQLGYLL